MRAALAYTEMMRAFDPDWLEDRADVAVIIWCRCGRTAGPALTAFALIERRVRHAEAADAAALDAFMSTRRRQNSASPPTGLRRGATRGSRADVDRTGP